MREYVKTEGEGELKRAPGAKEREEAHRVYVFALSNLVAHVRVWQRCCVKRGRKRES